MTEKIALQNLLELTVEVRLRQQKFFRTKLNADLKAAKDAEKRLDKMLMEYQQRFPAQPKQQVTQTQLL